MKAAIITEEQIKAIEAALWLCEVIDIDDHITYQEALAIIESLNAQERSTWHHPDCHGQCIACLIESTVEKEYGSAGLNYLNKHIHTVPHTTPDSTKRSADSAESFCKQELHNLMSVAGRMALELECLLLDTKDLSVVSKWWDTGMESLQSYREYIWSITHGKDGEHFCDTHCVHTDHHPDCKVTEQEPVAEVVAHFRNALYQVRTLKYHLENGTLLYTAPPKREWVGLTDDEISESAERMEAEDPEDSFWRDYARDIEAKVKELNT